MKIFVTVGTTKFDSLIKIVDEKLFYLDYEVIMQISDGDYKPKNFEYFDFTNDIQSYFLQSDIIITHAGAGSIYELLELGKKIIIVPNLDRIDKHQSDIANFMDSNNYAKSIYNLDNIVEIVKSIENHNFKKFKKKKFFKAQEIIDFIFE
ncbi:glycosyltransferase [bacterium]|nr:glycosyltransferase [Actinomycetota bacterium]MBE32667.1 glycosyltransferase [bacterium]|tara:strand:+ start:2681 stop:3130 length:450 start_codon:yes stop_codon:yes gene_type:complete